MELSTVRKFASDIAFQLLDPIGKLLFAVKLYHRDEEVTNYYSRVSLTSVISTVALALKV